MIPDHDEIGRFARWAAAMNERVRTHDYAARARRENENHEAIAAAQFIEKLRCFRQVQIRQYFLNRQRYHERMRMGLTTGGVWGRWISPRHPSLSFHLVRYGKLP